jgi:hypothetical protein
LAGVAAFLGVHVKMRITDTRPYVSNSICAYDFSTWLCSRIATKLS